LIVELSRTVGPEAITDAKLDPDQIDKAVARLKPVVAEVLEFGGTQVLNELRAQARDAGVEVKLSHSKIRERTICLRWIDMLELRDQPLDEIDVDSLLTARLKILVGRMAQKTEQAAWQLAATAWRTMGGDGLTPEEMGTIKGALVQAVEQDAQFISSVSVSEAMNLGRDAEAQRLISDIQFTEYSAILDTNVCPNCAAADEHQMQIGSKDYYAMMPPLSGGPFGSCRGKFRCRCIFLYVLRASSNTGLTGEDDLITLAAGGRQAGMDATWEKRFWSKVNRNGEGGCWLWTGSTNNDGYATVRIKDAPGKYRVITAHTAAYQLKKGAIPAGQHVLHSDKCKHRNCVNPAHLRVGSVSENASQREEEARKK